MQTVIYRRLPYADVPFRLEDGRIIYLVTHEYQEKTGRRPHWTPSPPVPLGKVSLLDSWRLAEANPGEIFTADFFCDDRTETEIHEYLNALEAEGKILAVGHVDGCTPRMTPEYDEAFYRLYEHAAGFVVDSRNHDTGVKADEVLPLFMVNPGESFYTGNNGCVDFPALLPLSVFGRDWGAGSLDEHRKEAKKNATEAEKMGKVRRVGTCSGGGRYNVLTGKIEHYCIEFTDPEARALFMKFATDRYFEWLEKQQNRR